MSFPDVAAAIYCMPESGCGGELLPLPVYRPQFEALVRDGAQRVRERAFACFSLSAKRDGLHCDLGGGIARFELEDWQLAWDQLGIPRDAEFEAHEAIDTHRKIRDKIASGTIAKKRGQHGRKSNKSKSGAASGDLDERCYVESIVHCRGDDETLYAAAKRALGTTPANLLPVNLRGRVDLVNADQAESYSGKRTMRDVIKIMLGNVRAIEVRHGDSRRL